MRGRGKITADSRYDELERRVRTVEEELTGEKNLTRYAVEQTTRNSEVLLALRVDVSAVILRVDHLGADMAAVKAELAMHGRALDVLQQDVRQLRGQMIEMRAEVSEIRTHMTDVHPDDRHAHRND
jgi:hypothetical protein